MGLLVPPTSEMFKWSVGNYKDLAIVKLLQHKN
jgi:hypothetical protein